MSESLLLYQVVKKLSNHLWNQNVYYLFTLELITGSSFKLVNFLRIISPRFLFVFSPHLRLSFPSDFFPEIFITEMVYALVNTSYTLYVAVPAVILWFNNSNNIG
jgi:hypothetical protein